MKPKDLKGALLLAGGITIGVVVSSIAFHFFDDNDKHRAQDTSSPKAAPAATQKIEYPPGAALAETPPATAQPAAAPQDWLKPHQVSAHNATMGGSASTTPQYKSSHTTYYVYGGVPGADITHHQLHPSVMPTELTTTVSGYPMPAGVAAQYDGMTLLQNPCVDPPSVMRGRAYRQIVKH